MRLERDEHHRHKDVYEHSLTVLEQAIALEHRLDQAPDFIVRFAALMHDIGKPRTRKFQPDGTVTFHHHDVVGAKMCRKRMRALRFSGDTVTSVCHLVELHLRFHGYGSGEWTDSAVRRYVRDAGDELPRLHVLTRADCTTRNARKAARLQRTYDHLEERIARLAEQEELQLPAAGPRRQPDHGGAGRPARPRRRRGLPLPAGAAHRARARSARSGPRPSCSPGGGPDRRRPREAGGRRRRAAPAGGRRRTGSGRQQPHHHRHPARRHPRRHPARRPRPRTRR